jgi:chaperonin cofactor prefoldin
MSVVPDVAPATLSERLLPLRGKRRGDPIQADDWNTVVQACLSILEMVQNEAETARARLEANFARREHDHIGEVSLSWLDPEMQQRIGSAVDAAGRGVVATLEKRVEALDAQVKGLQASNSALESRLDRLGASDVDRTLTIRNLGERVKAFGDFDGRLATLSTSVATLSPKIDDVFKLREALTDEQGNTIKLLDLRTDVQKLERLGSQLTGIDGNPVRITDLQQQIRDLRDAAGIGQGLEPRLAILSSDIETRLNTKFEGNVRDLRTTLVTDQETRITNSVSVKVSEAVAAQNTTINTRLSSIEQSVTQAVSTSVLGTVRADLETRGRAIDEKLATVGALVNTAVLSARPDIEKSVRDTVTPSVLQEVRTAAAATDTRLNDKVRAIETTVTTLRNRLPNDIDTAVRELTETATTDILGTVDTRVNDARASILAIVPDTAKEAANAVIGNLDARISTAVADTVGDLDARVSTAVGAATINLPALAEQAAKAEVDKLDVPALVSRSTAQVEQRINTAVAQRFQVEQANRTDAINRTVISLRGEMAATAKNEVEILRRENDLKIRDIQGTLQPRVIRPIG